MSELSNRYEQVKLRIKTATQQVKGQVSPVLLAVSKKHGVDKIKALAAAGQRDFGESYVQEGIEKISQLKDLSLVWHFIGPIQSNKAKQIAEHFDWVHSVDRLKVLKLLNQHRPDDLPPLNLLLQLKVGDEESKSGASYDEVMELAKIVESLNDVVLRGLMCIPPPSDDFNVQCSYFKQAKKAFEDLSAQYSQVDTLSMGMSGDLEAAIQTGSTVVRIGTDLFGPRPN
jgi:pyridoxal phosphate enzyme (YggS family)